MSYRRTYSASVYYSGEISYPPSEHGGTKSYSGSIPVDICIDVDTDNFDSEIAGCNGAISGLTGAVVATEAAQVETKRRTSRQVASTIVKGFFNFVAADLSQKVKELTSQCEALFGELMGHKDHCLSKSEQMKVDYNRITKRYSKVFSDLDHETETRIWNLDRPAFQFSESAYRVIGKSADSELLGLATVSANENLRLGLILSCSHVKRQAETVLKKTNDYLYGTYKLAHSIREMLTDTPGNGDIMVPVMFAETSDNAGTGCNIYGVDRIWTAAHRNVDDRLLSCFMSPRVAWQNCSSSEYDKILSYIHSDIHSGGLDDRVVKTMLELLNNQTLQTIKH